MRITGTEPSSVTCAKRKDLEMKSCLPQDQNLMKAKVMV